GCVMGTWYKVRDSGIAALRAETAALCPSLTLCAYMLSVTHYRGSLSMLCEGSSCRSISRVADVSLNTVYKTLIDAGKACARFHDETVRGVASKRVQCDEAWSFCYAKQKNVAAAKAAPAGAGDVWTWT